nr:hypothetical protein [Pseudomonas aeruginosa]
MVLIAAHVRQQHRHLQKRVSLILFFALRKIGGDMRIPTAKKGVRDRLGYPDLRPNLHPRGEGSRSAQPVALRNRIVKTLIKPDSQMA